MELEDYLQSHLYRPGPVLLQEDHAEVRAAQISRREAELGPVEEIKDLCTELDSHLLSYRRVLKDGDILAPERLNAGVGDARRISEEEGRRRTPSGRVQVNIPPRVEAAAARRIA